MEHEYILTSDDDGHHCVIPADKEQEFNDYLTHVELAGRDDGDYPREPEWIDWVGGSPTLVRFTNYRMVIDLIKPVE